VVVVAAAGNERQKGNPVDYPAAVGGVIAVAATDANDVVANYSEQGSFVDVAAPGSAILSTYPAGLNGTGYAIMYGTSMASPHVAAVAALLKAYRPALTPDQVESALENSATDLGTPGRDDDYGYGRIDAAAALAAVDQPTDAPVTTPPTSGPTTNPTAEPTYGPTAGPTEGPGMPEPTPSGTTPELVTPVVTPNATARLVRYGTSPTMTFTVTANGEPMAGQPAYLCLSVGGAAFSCTAATTDAHGVITSTMRATTPYRIRLMVPATAGTAAAMSPTANYKVQAAVTATAAADGALAVAIGGIDRQTVSVQRQDGTGWVTVKTFKAVAHATVTGLAAQKGYRVVVPGTPIFAGVTSATVLL
jgi:hypothetical protein